MITAMKIT